MFPDLKLKIKVKAGNLSGDQQQMLALARGLVSDPKFYCWTSRLSDWRRKSLRKFLRKSKK